MRHRTRTGIGAGIGLLAMLLARSGAASAAEAVPPAPQPAAARTRDTFPDTWVATDALGRTLPTGAEAGPPRPNRTVGIFYFLWMQRDPKAGVYDNTKLLAANPDDPRYGPLHAFHWWGQPYLGYYASDDRFVIRKHAQMLADAGVDVILCDVTNAFTYDETFRTLCEVYEEVRRDGGRTPQIAFVTHARSGPVVQKLYDGLYSRNLYPDLWFRWLGKPLILADPATLTPQLRDFFTVRASWAWTNPDGWFGDGRDRWPWLDSSPQKPGWHDSPDKPEEISVAIAGHPTTDVGRSMQKNVEPPLDRYRLAADRAKGMYFTEQWKRALQVDPEFVFVTGWNEWIAQRFENGPNGHQPFLGYPLKPGESFFVDEYNEEFSRDAEPMAGGHGDDYYYQLAAFIRRYKGARPVPKASPPKTIRLNPAGFAAWERVGPEYRDDIGDTAHRDAAGWGPTHYRNATGRNDFVQAKVARDAKNLYFLVRTRDPITPPDDGSNWMTLLLDTDRNPANGWNGYDYAVRCVRRGGRLVEALCRWDGKGGWTPLVRVSFVVSGDRMMLSIPRALLGLGTEKGPLRLDFQWADNAPVGGDILGFIDQGDVAPNGRFRYRYEE